MIPAPSLEIAVLLWGLILMLAESFAGKTDRRGFAIAGIAGLFVVLVASFFLAPSPATAFSGFWSFYTADPLAIFFKRFALVTTILVLVMAIDYAPAIRMGVPGCEPARRPRRIFHTANFHLCRPDVDGVGDRLCDDLCLDRIGHDVVLCAREFYAAQSCDA